MEKTSGIFTFRTPLLHFIKAFYLFEHPIQPNTALLVHLMAWNNLFLMEDCGLFRETWISLNFLIQQYSSCLVVNKEILSKFLMSSVFIDVTFNKSVVELNGRVE